MVAHALLGRLPPCLLSSADIPTLMYNIQQDPEHRVNLIGAAVGNGVGGHNDTGGDAARGRALFYYGKGLFSTTLKDTIEKECGSLFYPSGPGWAQQTPACSKVRPSPRSTVSLGRAYVDLCLTILSQCTGFSLWSC